MAAAQRAGIEAVLPQVAAAAVQVIDILRIKKMGSADGLGQRLRIGRSGNEVDVIGHQAPAEDLKAVFFGLLFEDRQVHPPVVIDEEDILAVVTPLGNMVRYFGYCYACFSWHNRKYMP